MTCSQDTAPRRGVTARAQPCPLQKSRVSRGPLCKVDKISFATMTLA